MKNPALRAEVSFFSALWIVFPESWKRSCPNFYAHDCKKPFFGKSFTPLARVLDSAFEDGIEEIRSKAKNGRPLASTRVISTTIRGVTKKQGATQKLSDDFTALFVAFAQFVDHDTDHVPIQGM